jgi:hypothetical protein
MPEPEVVHRAGIGAGASQRKGPGPRPVAHALDLKRGKNTGDQHLKKARKIAWAST